MAIIDRTSTSTVSQAELTRQDVESGNIPRFLYKFRPPNVFTKNVIKNSALYFSTPQSFNDPFDCQLTLDTNLTRDEITTYLSTRRPALSKPQIKRLLADWKDDPIAFRRSANRTLHEALSKHGISCFAPNADSILMWSHYTDSHRGLCLKFDVLSDPSAFTTPYKVEYQENYPIWNHFKKGPGETITKMITTKAKVWEYEQEYRIFKPNSPGNHAFKKEALVEVIFGCNASQAFIEDVRTIAYNAKMHQVKFSKAQISKRRFALIFKEIQ